MILRAATIVFLGLASCEASNIRGASTKGDFESESQQLPAGLQTRAMESVVKPLVRAYFPPKVSGATMHRTNRSAIVGSVTGSIAVNVNMKLDTANSAAPIMKALSFVKEASKKEDRTDADKMGWQTAEAADEKKQKLMLMQRSLDLADDSASDPPQRVAVINSERSSITPDTSIGSFKNNLDAKKVLQLVAILSDPRLQMECQGATGADCGKMKQLAQTAAVAAPFLMANLPPKAENVNVGEVLESSVEGKVIGSAGVNIDIGLRDPTAGILHSVAELGKVNFAAIQKAPPPPVATWPTLPHEVGNSGLSLLQSEAHEDPYENMMAEPTALTPAEARDAADAAAQKEENTLYRAAYFKDDGGPVSLDEWRYEPITKDWFTFPQALKRAIRAGWSLEQVEAHWRIQMKPEWVMAALYKQ